MFISDSMIRFYLSDVVVSWFNRHEIPPENIEDYCPYIFEMEKGAIKHGDHAFLRTAFEYILTHPDVDLEKYNGSRYPYDDAEMREIIHLAWQTLWPSAQLPSSDITVDVQLVPMPLEDWWEKRPLP